MVAVVVTSSESLPFPGETGSASGLQIRHRRFDSDRSLSTEDPRDVPEIPGFAGVFLFLQWLVADRPARNLTRHRLASQFAERGFDAYLETKTVTARLNPPAAPR